MSEAPPRVYLAPRVAAAASEPWDGAVEYVRGERLIAALKEAVLQIEYLHDKFQPTSSGEAVLTRARIALQEVGE